MPTLPQTTVAPSPVSTIAPGTKIYKDGSYTVEWTETYSSINFKFSTRGSAYKNKYSAFSFSNDPSMVNFKFHKNFCLYMWPSDPEAMWGFTTVSK